MALTIQIEIEGKKKTFVAPSSIKARVIRTAVDIEERAEKDGISTALLDDMVSIVVTIFGNKFTADDVWDGINSNKIFSEMSRVISGAAGGANGDIVELPNAVAAK